MGPPHTVLYSLRHWSSTIKNTHTSRQIRSNGCAWYGRSHECSLLRSKMNQHIKLTYRKRKKETHSLYITLKDLIFIFLILITLSIIFNLFSIWDQSHQFQDAFDVLCLTQSCLWKLKQDTNLVQGSLLLKSFDKSDSSCFKGENIHVTNQSWAMKTSDPIRKLLFIINLKSRWKIITKFKWNLMFNFTANN